MGGEDLVVICFLFFGGWVVDWFGVWYFYVFYKGWEIIDGYKCLECCNGEYVF